MTAMVGDASDRAAGRPRALAADVAEAARSYAEQAFTILDPAHSEVVANGRVHRGDPVGLHEFRARRFGRA